MLKGRNWAFVVYPESLPKNYEDIITETGLPMAFSPLHDKDFDPTGEPKKPHYHVICYYENPTTAKSVQENVTSKLNGTIPIKLESMTGMYRYHIHIDNPDKFQYDDRDRKFYNGFDVGRVEQMTYLEVDKILKELQTTIRVQDFREYHELLDYLLDNELYQHWSIARTQTLFLNSYISSLRHSTEKRRLKTLTEALKNDIL